MRPLKIRNQRIKRDVKRLLEIVASASEPDYAEVEALARRNGFYYDAKGNVRESKI
ncbi:hypothetical protein [Bacillus chungangensis]|uniref:Fur-regulated basic protein FbpA n=1 Tax=Bacillus chungangensis TaxID=587633 RepID=A0ABT9WMD4_9BACI|nr:hypothetical protein [Bacillus chungangensis]MDQ0174416.1 hypothetical protein [Bacillus chungangensis]